MQNSPQKLSWQMFNDDPKMADDCGLGGHGLKIKFGQLFFSLLTKILPYVQCSATKKHRLKVCSTQWKSGTNYLLKYFYISSQAPLWLLQFQVTSHCSSDFSVRESTPTKPSSFKKKYTFLNAVSSNSKFSLGYNWFSIFHTYFCCQSRGSILNPWATGGWCTQ